MDSVFESNFADINAFVYRCQNDKDYTMDYVSGAVQKLTGQAEQDIVNNAKCSFVDLTFEEDRDRMLTAIYAAIEAKEPWHVTYRFVYPSGRQKWVRERGSAVYVDGQLAFLQGMVVGGRHRIWPAPSVARTG